jgi:transposase-like protein
MKEPQETFGCPRCGSKNTIWIGYRYNISGKKRIRRCKKCQAKFSPANNFARARYDKAHLIEAVGLFRGGMSLSEVKKHMDHHRNVVVSRTSILNWAKKYSRFIEDFSQKLKYVIRGVSHCDGVYLDIKGDKVHYWGAMDSKVIFKIDSKLSYSNSKVT